MAAMRATDTPEGRGSLCRRFISSLLTLLLIIIEEKSLYPWLSFAVELPLAAKKREVLGKKWDGLQQ